MTRMTDLEITAATDALRTLLQHSTTYTVDAMDVCLRAAAMFALDGEPDTEVAARRLEITAGTVVEWVRCGAFRGERRLDS